MLSLRQQNTEALLDYLHSATRLTTQLSDIEGTVLSQGWCSSLTQPDDMTRFRQVLNVSIVHMAGCGRGLNINHYQRQNIGLSPANFRCPVLDL